MTERLIDYINKIRDGIMYEKISTQIPNYRLLCSALDTVSDAEDSIYSYLHLEDQNGRGINYIYCYGIISLIATEIQAVKVIYKILTDKEIDITEIPDLEIIRLLRNKIFAHPVDLSERNGKQGFGLIASHLSTFSFYPYSFENDHYEDGTELTLYEKVTNLANNKINYHDLVIDIQKLIENKNISLAKYLKEICEEKSLTGREDPKEYIKISNDHPLMKTLESLKL